MKVLKFGGTSVGTVEGLLSLKSIVEQKTENDSIIVVVSAFCGVTDALLNAVRKALVGDNGYKKDIQDIASSHVEMTNRVISNPLERASLKHEIDALCDELSSICHGVCLVHDLSEKTENAIVSYGERLSSIIVAKMLGGATLYDARTFIITERKNGKHVLDVGQTEKHVCNTLACAGRLSVVPGFISSDGRTGETTNLGRGGSDYTAAIIAAALEADTLEIWTDVDGFMTADPKVIPTAYTIRELSYREAMELCNFGAKVIYPPTIYPVCVKNIPILVKNTFNPEGTGTVIKADAKAHSMVIRGMSSISQTTLITVTGLSMVGVIGVNRRIFTALADNGISVFLVSQASSENSTSIAVKDEDAEEAVRVLDEEFAGEIATGAMFPMHAESGLATIAVVGENMRHTPGVAGKLFGTLGRSGINVIACSQGALETNISFVVEGSSLRKALNVIHDSFFLSEYNVLNLFICGVGTVGGRLIEQICAQYGELKRKRRLKLNVVGIANSTHAIFNRDGIDLDGYADMLRNSEHSDITRLRNEIVKMNIFNSVFVDCTASKDVAQIYQDLLEHNISVVAANKTAASADYESYTKLKQTALARGVKFRFETNVGAGLPIIGTINDLRYSGDRILHIEAVLSGTLNFIFNEIAAGTRMSEAVRHAKEQGYSEPDPRVDLSGIDVVRKIVILTREAGYKIGMEDVKLEPLMPSELFEGHLDDFWKQLPDIDDDFERRRLQAGAEGKRLRFVAEMDKGQARVSLRAIGKEHPFYNLEGSNNIVMLTTERYKEYPMLIQGYGAGAGVTAAGVFANILSIANV